MIATTATDTPAAIGPTLEDPLSAPVVTSMLGIIVVVGTLSY